MPHILLCKEKLCCLRNNCNWQMNWGPNYQPNYMCTASSTETTQPRGSKMQVSNSSSSAPSLVQLPHILGLEVWNSGLQASPSHLLPSILLSLPVTHLEMLWILLCIPYREIIPTFLRLQVLFRYYTSDIDGRRWHTAFSLFCHENFTKFLFMLLFPFLWLLLAKLIGNGK